MNTRTLPLLARRQTQTGVALIEALVALAVMAVGLLGVVGMQATLRTNAELSRQRSEAVRMAQEKIESLRAFSRLGVEGSGAVDEYAYIVTSPVEDVTPSASRASATFKRTVDVVPPGTTDPLIKTLTVRVKWWDRRADVTDPNDPNIQEVVLNTAVARVDPALGTGLALPTNRSALQRPGGRNVIIPQGAVGSGTTSTFTPPGSGGVSWTFNNRTGDITSITTSTGTTAVNGLLLSGYVRFATGAVQPTWVDAEVPPGTALASLGMQVTLTVPASPSFAPACYVGAVTTSGAVPYYCAVPIANGSLSWSGRSELTSLSLASSSTDPTASRYRVCRYTPDPTTDTPAAGNVAHPLDYAVVTTGLTNQNFLVIRGGDGSTAFTCPVEPPACPAGSPAPTCDTTPLVDGDTRRHQPVI